MAHRDELQQAVYDQQMIVNALHSDLSNPKRLQDEIDRKQAQANQLLAQITELEQRRDRLPALLTSAQKKLGTLKYSLKVASNPEINKILRLQKKLKEILPDDASDNA